MVVTAGTVKRHPQECLGSVFNGIVQPHVTIELVPVAKAAAERSTVPITAANCFSALAFSASAAMISETISGFINVENCNY